MYEDVKRIMEKHVGEENAITSWVIASLLGIPDNATTYRTRKILFEAAEELELPLAASGKGYYLISNDQEYNKYMKNLNSRQAGIDKRKEIVTKNYWKKTHTKAGVGI